MFQRHILASGAYTCRICSPGVSIVHDQYGNAAAAGSAPTRRSGLQITQSFCRGPANAYTDQSSYMYGLIYLRRLNENAACRWTAASGTQTFLVLLTGLVYLTFGQARDTGAQLPRWSPQARFLQVLVHAAVLASCNLIATRGEGCISRGLKVCLSGDDSAVTML